MAAFVKNVGSNASSNSTTSIVTVPAAGVASGNKVVVRGFRAASGSQTISGIVDSRGNSYAQVMVGGDTGNVCIWRGTITTALQSGDTITSTFDAMGTVRTVVDEFSATSTTEDGENVAFGTGTAPSVAFTPVNATDLIVACLGVTSGSADSFTEDADSAGGDTWHTLTAQLTTHALRGAYKITTSAVTQTYNPTLGTSRAWDLVIGSLQATAAAAGFATPLMDLQQAVKRAAHY